MPENAAFLVLGSDLASAEAAVKLAGSGCRVELSTPSAEICLDAHPGYRALHRRLIAEFGGSVTSCVAAPETHGGKRIVVGPMLSFARGEEEPAMDDWIYPYANLGVPDAHIDDAYEPGRMTAGIYAAVELAQAA